MTPIIARESRLLIRYFVVMNFVTEDFRRIDNCKNLFFLHIRIYYPTLTRLDPLSRRCWGEREKEVSNAANTSAIRAGIPAPHIEPARSRRPVQELARECEPSANAIRK